MKNAPNDLYVIDDLSDSDTLFKNLRGNIRREINKANKSLTISECDNVSVLHALKEQDYQAKKQAINYTSAYFNQLYIKLKKKEACKAWIASDSDGKPIASLLLVWDADSAYYLAGAVDPANKNAGAISLLLWTAIQC